MGKPGILMHRAYLWITTAILEAGTDLALLFVPSVPLALLLGVAQAAPEALFVGRVTGAALFAIGVACGLRGATGAARRGLGC